jgi:hypothetical protein
VGIDNDVVQGLRHAGQYAPGTDTARSSRSRRTWRAVPKDHIVRSFTSTRSISPSSRTTRAWASRAGPPSGPVGRRARTGDGSPLIIGGTGYFARCLQHETDHLLGHLYLDRLSKRDRKDALRQMTDRRESVFAQRATKAARLGH